MFNYGLFKDFSYIFLFVVHVECLIGGVLSMGSLPICAPSFGIFINKVF